MEQQTGNHIHQRKLRRQRRLGKVATSSSLHLIGQGLFVKLIFFDIHQ